MSRSANIEVSVRNFDLKQAKPIIEAINDEWDFDQKDYDASEIFCSGSGSIPGGISSREVATHITRAVWLANKAFCVVQVSITEPRDPDIWEMEAEQYNAWKAEDDARRAADPLRCRYDDCDHPVTRPDDNVTCPKCRKAMGLEPLEACS